MKKLRKNITSSICKQIFAIVYGLVIPRLILLTYGSEVNGLINSITQFLSIISYLDLGVNAVVQSELYSPLSCGDTASVSRICSSARKFFKTIAYIMMMYVVFLMIVYPSIINDSFDTAYIAIVIVALSINSFAQYYFGIVNFTLLRADQKGYLYDWLSVLSYCLNVIIGYLIIKLGGSIQLFEITTSVVFLIRPVLLSKYVHDNYKIDYSIKYTEEPIKQKWNGMAQHFSAVIIDSTDIIVLTLFSTLQNVSIYSVYNLVVMAVRSIMLSTANGISAHFGNLLSRARETEVLESFKKMEWTINSIAVILFGCTSVLIVPFIKIYTMGVTDADYIVPIFAFIIVVAQFFRIVRLPYNVAILSAGHFKQTQSCYIVAIFINLITSVLLVIKFGLIGVAVGTLASLLYQDVWMAKYVSKDIVKWPFRNFLRQNVANAMIWVAAFIPSYYLSSNIDTGNYLDWIILSCATFGIWTIISALFNLLFYKELTTRIVNKWISRYR